MSDQIFVILRVDYRPSSKEEVAVGYAHYEFDMKRIIEALSAQTGSSYIYRAIPCLTAVPGHC